jgi:hypothetical protein
MTSLSPTSTSASFSLLFDLFPLLLDPFSLLSDTPYSLTINLIARRASCLPRPTPALHARCSPRLLIAGLSSDGRPQPCAPAPRRAGCSMDLCSERTLLVYAASCEISSECSLLIYASSACCSPRPLLAGHIQRALAARCTYRWIAALSRLSRASCVIHEPASIPSIQDIYCEVKYISNSFRWQPEKFH